MAFVDRYEVVRWFTTPTELRQVALEMERIWQASLGGEDLTAHRYFDNKNKVEIQVIVDQDEQRRLDDT